MGLPTALVTAAAAGGLAALLAAAAPAGAEPYPGCPFETHTVYSVCSDNPGVPGFTPGFTLTPGVPGTFGPQGIYTPIQQRVLAARSTPGGP